VYHNTISAHLTISDCEGSSAVDRTDDNMLWNDSEEDWDVRSECDEYEGTGCKDEESYTVG